MGNEKYLIARIIREFELDTNNALEIDDRDKC